MSEEPDVYQQPPGGGKGDVYGTDDRKERFEVSADSLERRLAMSSAMLASVGKLTETAGGFELAMLTTLGAQKQLCAGERFVAQPMGGFCSATLIAPNLVITSGHCLMHGDDGLDAAQVKCANTLVVFDFAYDTPPSDPIAAVQKLPKSAVYRCVRVVAGENPDGGSTLTQDDYAILELDRDVEGRDPLPIYGGADLTSGSPAIQIGHPSGIPQKITPATVYEKLDPATHNAYRYESDLFGGNSGGGVFDRKSEALFGVPTLFSGRDYVWDAARSCYVTGVCGENATCPQPPGVYDTAAMIPRLPAELTTRLTIVGTR